MPMINIKYNNKIVNDDEITNLSEVTQKIVSDVTGIKDVFVYADSPKIMIKVAPIEIFVEMSATKIEDKDILIEQIKNKLSQWKKENNFNQPINLSLIPMNWKIEIDI